MGVQVGNRYGRRSVTARVAMEKDRVPILGKCLQLVQGRGKSFIEAIAIEIRNRGAMVGDVVLTAFRDESGQIQSFCREILGVLQAQDGGDAKLLAQPRHIFNARIFTD